MRSARAAVVTLGWWCLTGAHGQEPQQPAPDLDFLEYLGAWVEEDDEWLAIEEWQKDNGTEPREDPERSERPEDDDDESE